MKANRLNLLQFLVTFSLLSAFASPTKAQTQAIAPAPDGTGTVVIPQGNRIDIQGGSLSGDKANLFHSFTQFGLSEGQIANFLTNPNIRNILGRVTGGDASIINGLIQVTGGNSNLFLMNPAGIVFGPNASLNVPASFTATTATGIGFGNNNWFNAIGNNNWANLVGTPNTFAFTAIEPGTIINAGNLAVTTGSNLTLMGGTVVNTGQLTTASGNILINAVPGQNLVRISQAGHLLSLEVQPLNNAGLLPNTWTESVRTLPQLLTGKGLESAAGLTVNAQGQVVLTGNNTIVPGVAGTAIASGNINTSGTTGGTVNVFGDKVGVIGGNINASGIYGGGTVLIGGDYQGKGTVPNASRTFVSNNSTINVDGVSNGNGGRAIVWADDATRFYGNISARGGAFSGDGGFVEVSGYKFLDFQGNVNTLAPNGTTGLLLLDPTDITIIATPGSFTVLTDVDQFADPDIGGNTLDVALINNAATNVTLQATGNITFGADVNIGNSAVGLTAQANNEIFINNNITTNGGSVSLIADADNSTDGSLNINGAIITTNGGNFLGIGNGTAAWTSGIRINNSAITVGNGNINLTGRGQLGYGIEISNSSLDSAQGNITLNGAGDFTLGIGISISNISTVRSVQGNINLSGSVSLLSADAISLNTGSLISTIGGGSVTLTSSNGNINTSAGNINTNFTGGGGAIAISTTAGGDITTGNLSSFATGVAAGGNITLSVTGGTGYIDTTAGTLNANSTLGNGGAIALSTTGGGDITTNILLSTSGGAGTGGNITISVSGGNGSINTTNVGLLQSNSNSGNGGAIALSTTGGDIITNILDSYSGGTGTGGNITLSVTGGNGSIDTSAGNIVSASNSGNGGAIALSTADGNITTSDLNSVSYDTGIGGNITLTAGGTGAIDTTGGNIDSFSDSGNGGAIALSTTGGNIITNFFNSSSGVGGVGTGGNITLSITGGNGSIDATGIMDSTSSSGNGGNILLSTTGGNITTTDLHSSTGGAGTSGNITVSVMTGNGVIDTSAGIISSYSYSGNAGAIALSTANGNITTAALTSKVSNGIGTGGNITLTAGGTGAIDTTANSLDSTSASGNGGAIALSTTGGDITTGSIDSSSSGAGNAGNITLSITGGTGAIDTTAAINMNATSSSGNGGAIAFSTAGGNIITDLFDTRSFGAGTGGNITLSVNGGTGAIDTTVGFIDSSSTSGNGGAIALSTTAGNINIGYIGSTSLGAGTGGNITFNSGTGNTIVRADVNSSSATGSGGNITFQSPVILTQPTTTLTTSGTTSSGNITFNSTLDGTTTSIEFLAVYAGTGNVTLGGAIGSIIPLGGLSIDTTGNVNFSQSANLLSLNSNGNTQFSGNITATGTDGIFLTGPTTITNNVILTSDATNWTNNVSGTGNLTIQPFTAGLPIDIGNTPVTGTRLNLTPTQIGLLQPSLASVTIQTNNGGDISVNDPITLNPPTTLQTSPGTITLNSPITGNNNAAITLSSNTTNLNADISTSNQNITINGNTLLTNNVTLNTNGNILLNGPIDGNNNLTANAGTGNITFGGAVGSSMPLVNITANSTGLTTFNAVNSASVTTNAGGTTQLNGNVTTTGAQTYNDAVTIANNPTLTGNGITFNSTLDGNSDLTANTGASNLSFNGAIGSITPLGNITANSTGITTFNAVNSASITTNIGGTTQLNGNVITTGTQTYNDAVTIVGNLTLNNDGISFNSPLTLTGNLTLNAGGGTVAFNAIAAANYTLSLSANEIDFNGIVTGNSTLTLTPGTPGQNITLGGLTDTGANSLDLTANDLNNLADGFSSIIIGNNTNTGNILVAPSGASFKDPVIMTTGTGVITLNGALTGIGNSSITLNAPTTFLNNDIRTAEQNITLNGNAIVGNSVTVSTGNLAGGDILFNGNINGNNNLTLETGTGNLTIVGAIGNNTPLGNLTFTNVNNVQANAIAAASLTQISGTGATTINGTINTNTATGINLTGNIFNFNGNVTTSNGGSFTINNSSPLTITSAAQFNLDGAFNQIGFGNVFLAGNITTNNSNISFKSPVTLIGATNLNTGAGVGDINFNNTLDGTNNLNLAAGIGNILFFGLVGDVVRIGDLTINSANDITALNSINAVSITQIAGGGTTLFNGVINTNGRSGITLAGTNFNLNGAIATNGGFTINNSGKLNLSISPLLLDGAFSQIGTGEVAIASNITTANQDIRFSGPVTLNTPVIFTLGNATIAFGSSLAAGNNPLNLIAGEIDFSGPVSGTNSLSLQPFNPGQNIVIGGFDNNTNALDLTAAEINTLQNGFSSITIGRVDGSANINIDSNVTFFDPLTIQTATGAMPSADAAIAVNGNITGRDNSSISLNAPTINIKSNINTVNNSIILNGNVNLGNDVELSSGGGDITIAGVLNGSQKLTINADTGNIFLKGDIGNITPLLGLELNGLNTTLSGNISSANSDIIFDTGLILTNDMTLTTGAIGGNITFRSTLDSEAFRGYSLNLTAGRGNVTFNGAVGAAVNGQLGNITINSANNITALSGISTRNFQSNSTANINFGNITATNVNITTDNNITVGNIISNGGQIRLNSNNGNLVAGDIDASLISGNGGTILLTTPSGAAITGNLNTSGVSGGDITVKAQTSITARQINSSGSVGSGGNVFLDPIGDIQVEFINAEGGINGTGGNVFIESTGGLFRATSSFVTPFSTDGTASISTAGGLGSGTITIRHAGGDGGQLLQPFEVGNAGALNGTAAAITSGSSIIETGQVFPGSFSVGNIGIETQDAAPRTITLSTSSTTTTDLSTSVRAPIVLSTPSSQGIQSSAALVPPVTPLGDFSSNTTLPGATEIRGENLAQGGGLTQQTGGIVPTAPVVSIDSTSVNSNSDGTLENIPLISTFYTEEERRKSLLSEKDAAKNIQQPILEIDPKIIEPSPGAARASSVMPEGEKPARNLTPEDISNKPANLVLGYSASIDRPFNGDDIGDIDTIFEGGNIEVMVSQLEQIRNREFEQYLKVGHKVGGHNMSLSEIQQNLKETDNKTGKKSAVFYVVSRLNQLELVLVTSLGLPIRYSVPAAKRDALFPIINKFRSEMINSRKRNTKSYLDSAKQLYQWMILPIEADLKKLKIDTLLLSLDPGLRSVPIAALYDGNKFLIEKYSFSVIPSFSLTNTSYTSIANASVLAMGASEFTDQNPLPAVPVELSAIASQWQGKSFLNSTFTLENLNLQRSREDYRIIHLATHAEFLPGKPGNSYIQLWESKLPLDRVRNLNWDNPTVDLLVLSACKTALGDREAELGFAGLAVQSGAKSALASLWYVDDRGTLGLMTEFYQQLGKAAIKADALRFAQIAMLKGQVRVENSQLLTNAGKFDLPSALKSQDSTDFTHPYYWSGFTLVGNPW
ncbi:MAG TPA: CHAT domain-containing protein [Kamptonema sp.]|nr:CHAT domain-containing protein [Kamptonema sp.]